MAIHAMRDAIKNRVLPALRSQGYKGSYPQMRRIEHATIRFVNFHTYQGHDAFRVELRAGPRKAVEGMSRLEIISDLKPRFLPRPDPQGIPSFESFFYFEPAGGEGNPRRPESVAAAVLEQLKRYASEWWEKPTSNAAS